MARVKYGNLREFMPWRVAIAGDWHCHMGAHHARRALGTAKHHGIDVLIHVGDLGYHYDHPDGHWFDKPLRNALEEFDMAMVWIDGNHENHGWLREQPVREDGFVQTGAGGRLFWAPRGHRWTWFDRTFGALGGAFSINGKHLVEGVTFFPGMEEVQVGDLARLGPERLDVLLTHEVPSRVPVRKHLQLSQHLEDQGNMGRVLLQHAVEGTKPYHVFSGHWHQRLDHDLVRLVDGGVTQCHVLDMEHRAGNMVFLDLIDLTVETPPGDWLSQRIRTPGEWDN